MPRLVSLEFWPPSCQGLDKPSNRQVASTVGNGKALFVEASRMALFLKNRLASPGAIATVLNAGRHLCGGIFG